MQLPKWKNGKYLASIVDDSVITCDEIIQSNDKNAEAKSNNETNFNEKKATFKTQNFYILFAFLLITIALLIAVSIHCYLIKYQAKRKHLLPFHNINKCIIKISNKVKIYRYKKPHILLFQ